MPSKANIVTISYNDIVAACNSSNDRFSSSSSVSDLIEQAFGSSASSMGLIAITDIPSLPALRSKLLPLGRKLASLPAHQLQEITVPESQYQVGWSHGREKLEGDRLDFSKGSFYANPLTDDLLESMLQRRIYYHNTHHLARSDDDISSTSDNGYNDHDQRMMEQLIKWDESIGIIQTDDELRQLAQANPGFFASNVWPTRSLPELELVFKEMGRLIHTVGVYLAKCCDLYVAAQVRRTHVRVDIVFFLFICFHYFNLLFFCLASLTLSLLLVPQIQSSNFGTYCTSFQMLQGPTTSLLCSR
jgi:hypothetical protein